MSNASAPSLCRKYLFYALIERVAPAAADGAVGDDDVAEDAVGSLWLSFE